MWELDCEEGWAPKNWCFWTVVSEKILENLLDWMEIQPVHSKGDQSWVFIGKTDAKAETPILWLPNAKCWLIGKDSDAGRDWGQEEKGTTEDEMAGWHHWLNGCESEWTLGMNWANELNWTGDAQAHLSKCSHTSVLLLSHFSWVRLCVTPKTAAHQAPPSLGFSRQEHWSGLPFPSPMHESENWKWSRSVVSYPQRLHGLQPTRLLHPCDFLGRSTGVGCHCLLVWYYSLHSNSYFWKRSCLCVTFKSGVFISQDLFLTKVNPTGFQCQMFWGLIFLVQDLWYE